MVNSFENSDNLEIVIPIENIKELYSYQKAILSLMNDVDMEKATDERKKDFRLLHKLLGHFYQKSVEVDSPVSE